MKKGFTLAEMLGVITILAIIGLLVFPAVDSSIKEGKEKVYRTQVRNIEEGAKQWAIDASTPNLEDDGDVAKVTIYQLKQAGRVDNNVTNPKTKKPFGDELVINITKTAGDYTTSLIEAEGNLNDTTLNVIPLVKLKPSQNCDKGTEIVYCEYKKNSPTTYFTSSYQAITEVLALAEDSTPITDITYKVYDANGGDVTGNNFTMGQLGTYYVYYHVKYNNYTIRLIRTVIVRDSIAPTLTVPTSTKVSRSNAASYDLIGTVTCTDESDCDVVADRTLPSTIGTYTITYTATDRSKRKNSSTARRTIIVQ